MKLTSNLHVHVAGIMGLAEFRCELEHGRATEIVGRNAAGKSSLATALMAVAAREPNPRGLPVATARRAYISDGTEPGDAFAEAQWVHDDGVGGWKHVWRPGTGEIEAGPEASISSGTAVGLVDFTAKRGAKERAAIIQGVLLPPAAEVEAKVEAVLTELLGEQDARGAIKMVRERGWEAAATVYAERGRQAKREWSAVTHRTYGTKVADDWRPDGWVASLDNLTVIEAQSAVTAARDGLAALHQVHAVTESRKQDAAIARERMPEALAVAEAAAAEEARHRDVYREVTDSHRELYREIEQHQRTVANLRKLDTDPQCCPSCNCPLTVDMMGNIVVAEPITDAQKAQIQESQQRVDELRARIDTETQKVADKLQDVSRKAEACHGEVRRLERIVAEGQGEVQTAETAQQIADAETTVDRAKEHAQMVEDVARAIEAHQTAVRYAAAAHALGPRGPRGDMIEAGLKRLQAGLWTISEVAGWPLTSVDQAGSVTVTVDVGDRPVELCSESEQWRSQAAIQLTVAALDGSGLVVLDRADVLDEQNRSGLNAALTRVCDRTGITVAVCATGAPTFPDDAVVEVGE